MQQKSLSMDNKRHVAMGNKVVKRGGGRDLYSGMITKCVVHWKQKALTMAIKGVSRGGDPRCLYRWADNGAPVLCMFFIQTEQIIHWS